MNNRLFKQEFVEHHEKDEEVFQNAFGELVSSVKDYETTLIPRELPMRKLSLLDLLRYGFGVITKKDIIEIMFITLIISGFGMINPWIQKQIFDYIIPSGIKSTLVPISIMVIGVLLSSSIFLMVRASMLTQLNTKISHTVQQAIMKRILSLQTQFFRDYTSGELATIVMQMGKLSFVIGDTLFVGGLSLLFSILYWFQMQYYAKELITYTTWVLMGYIVISSIKAVLIYKVENIHGTKKAKLNGFMFQLFSGISKIKLMAAEKRAFAKWAKAYTEAYRVINNPSLLIKMIKGIEYVFFMSITIGQFFLATTNGITASDFIAFNAAYGLFTGVLLQVQRMGDEVAIAIPILQRIKPILEAEPERNDEKIVVNDLKGEIEINNLCFSYNKNQLPILKNVNLKIRKGEYIAIVGGSGSGKSTLLRLLLGFEKPDQGGIYYDNKELATLDIKSLRKHIGVVLQNAKLISGTIFTNLAIGSNNFTEKDAWAVLEQVGIEQDIQDMPLGLHTILSEGGANLSGGQRQRIVIARALCRKPHLLIFDEATSNLDNVSQKQVLDTLDSLECTRIVVAHRLSTIRNCHKIVVLDKGEIVQEGDYETLLRDKDGFFAKLARRQMV